MSSEGNSCFGSELSNQNNQDGAGVLPFEPRNRKILRYWTKKSNRNSHKKVRYGCR